MKEKKFVVKSSDKMFFDGTFDVFERARWTPNKKSAPTYLEATAIAIAHSLNAIVEEIRN